MHWIEYGTLDGAPAAHSKTFWDSGFRGKAMTSSFGIRNSSFGMNATPTREAVESKCATTVGNIGLSAGRMKTVGILLPPLAEQRRIVAKVDELMALVDALETQLTTARTSAKNLLEALVAELTNQS